MNKYDLYMVKVVTNDRETIIKSNIDATSYLDMKELYKTTKGNVTSGNVLFIGINSTGYTTLESLKPTNELEIDIVVSKLIENTRWLLDYSCKSNELLGSINMSRDVFLKNVELFDSYNMDADFSSSNTRESIFEELKEILIMRRNIKYSNLLARKIHTRLDLRRILTVFEKSKEAMSQNSSVNISPSTITKEDEYEIGSLFNLDTINKISKIRKQHDKILVKGNKVIGYKKTNLTNDLDDYDEEFINSTKDIINSEIEYPEEYSDGDYNLKPENIDEFYDDYYIADESIDDEYNELEDNNIDFVDKDSFNNIQEDHASKVIKHETIEFNLIAKETDSSVHCYEFIASERSYDNSTNKDNNYNNNRSCSNYREHFSNSYKGCYNRNYFINRSKNSYDNKGYSNNRNYKNSNYNNRNNNNSNYKNNGYKLNSHKNNNSNYYNNSYKYNNKNCNTSKERF